MKSKFIKLTLGLFFIITNSCFTFSKSKVNIYPIAIEKINIRNYGAKGDGIADDTKSFTDAIQKAKDSHSPSIIFLPKGKYRITKPIRPEIDDLTIQGEGHTSQIIDDAFVGSTVGMAILINKIDAEEKDESKCFNVKAIFSNDVTQIAKSIRLVFIKNITLKDFDVYATHHKKSTESNGVININAAQNILIDNVNVFGNNDLIGHLENGIAVSQGTSGVIQNLIVDGVSKPAIYLSCWSHDIIVKNVIAQNTKDGTYGVGFGVCGDNITLENCKAINNTGSGFVFHPIAIVDPLDNLTGLIGKNISVKNCSSENNGIDGFDIDSGYQNVPQDISFETIKSKRNKGYGIKCSAGKNISFTNVIIEENGSIGLSIDDTHTNATVKGQLTPFNWTFKNFNLLNNLMLLNANVGAIGFRGEVKAKLSDFKIFTTLDSSHQKYGIYFFTKEGVGEKELDLTNIEINGKLLNAVGYDKQESIPKSGKFDIHYNGAPNGRLQLPVGSTYTDLKNGTQYKKIGFDSQSWEQR